jgi:uncharacterized protein (TIGR03083 family)
VNVVVDAASLARDERADLADFLAALTAEQWEAPSLCDGWRVRDVVAHVFSYEDLGIPGLLRRFLAGGLNPDRINAAGIAETATRTPDDLLQRARDYLEPSGLTAMFGGRIALTDALIHHQDIRRALGLMREIPAERLRCALDFAPTAPPLRARKRVRGLELVATDIGWRSGKGPEVAGPAEAILMAIAGRRPALDQLTGPGQPTLAARLS